MGTPIETRVRNLFARATILLVNAAAKVQRVQGRLLGGEVGDSLEYFEHYGLTTHPLPGLEAAVIFVGGSRDHGVVIGVADRKFRIKGLKPGEVALYTDEGDTLLLKRDRHMEINTVHLAINAEKDVSIVTESYTVNASQGVRYNTPTYTLGGGDGGCAASITANMRVDGDIESTGGIESAGDQVAGGISQIGHTHVGCQGGSTGAPQ